MKLIIKNLILLVLFCFQVKGQNKLADSLWIQYNASHSDTQRVNKLNKLFNVFSNSNSDSALTISSMALKLANEADYAYGKAGAYNNLGTIYYYTGDNTNALSNFLKEASIIENMGRLEMQSIQFKNQLSTSYNNIGVIYQRQKLYKQAETYFLKSIIIERLLGNMVGMAHSYNNIGTIKEELGNYDDAIKSYEMALKLKMEVKDTVGLSSTLINIGVVYMNQNKFRESKVYFEKALQLSKQHNNKQDMALAYINLGDLFYMKKDYSVSVKYYLDGMAICKAQRYDQFLSYAYNSSSLSYYKLKDYQHAFETFQLYTNLKDSMYSKDNIKTLNEMQMKYESESKEREIKLLLSEKEIQDLEINKKRTQIYVSIGGLILFLIIIVIAFNGYRQKHKANEALDEKNKKIELAYKIIEEKQREILDSINYAKRIQYTLLAHDEYLKAYLHDHFVFFKPKDIVSGDFY